MARILSIKGLTLALILFSVSVGVQAQTDTRSSTQPPGRINGQVRLANGQPAAEILVSCDAWSGGMVGQVRTDNGGRFHFENLGASQFTVSIRQPGYLPVSETVEMQTTSNAYVQFLLKPDPNWAPSAPSSVVDANVPADAQKEYQRGDATIATGKKEDIQAAIAHYKQSLTIYPQFLTAQLKLGTVYMDLGDWSKAEQTLMKALELNPKAFNALFALGEVYLRQKKDEEAEKVLLQGLQIEDRSPQAHLTLARVYVDMAAKIKDQTENRPLRVKAYDQVNATLKYDANNAFAHWVKGNLLVSVGRDQDAQHEFEEYLRLDEKGPFANQSKTFIERIKKELESQKKP
jgi:cytochrome c-type biogenesis protein CcmH/NrfG